MSRTCSRTHAPIAAILAALLVSVAGPAPLRADGGFMPPYGRDIYEPGQTAYIRYDSATASENLSILPRFTGPATDFAWVVPVPALPTVAEADEELFRELSAMTAPVRRSRDAFWSCKRDYTALAGAGDGAGVEIIDESLIGIYRTMILGADDADALVDSLTTWGFLHEGNVETVTPLLQDYVADGWYFVTMTIDSTAVASAGYPYGKAATYPGVPYFYYPALQPVSFTFASPDIIYPLRISRISAYEYSAVTLYVAADHRVDFPTGRTSYANRVSDAEFDAIVRQYPLVGGSLSRGAFLTRLSRSYTPQEMDADIVLARAHDDREFLPVYYSGLPVWTLLFGGSVLWWLRRRLRHRAA